MEHELKYHQAVFSRMGINPFISPQRLAAIEVCEALCHIRFPDSVRELFSIAWVEKIFHENSNSDYLCDYDGLGLDEDRRPTVAAQGYLQVALDYDHDMEWYVILDGSDDPRVFLTHNIGTNDLSNATWKLSANTFSSFIFDRIAARGFKSL